MSRRAATLGLLAVLGLASWWRAESLDRRPLWLDERWSERFLREAGDLGGVWAVATQDDHQHPPLAYAVQWLAAAPSDFAPAALRAPSLVAGVATVALVAVAGALLFDAGVGLLAAFLLAISIYHVDVSQDARPYALSALLTLGQYAALFAYLRDRRPIWLAPLAACATAGLYAYHLALLHVATTAGVAALDVLGAAPAERRRRAIAWGATFAAIALVYAPQAPNLVAFFASRGAAPNHRLWPTPRVLDAIAGRWASGGGAVILAYEVAVVAGAVRLARRRDLASLAVAGWLLAPIAVFTLRPFAKYFDFRFLISSLPAFFVLAAAGFDAVLARLRPPAARAAATALLAVACLVPATHLYALLRDSTRRCGDFVNAPEILEDNERLCADHLVLNTIYDRHQFIVKPVRPGVALAPEALDAYVGRYAFEDGLGLEITRDGDHLVAQVEERLRYALVPEGGDRFFYRVLGRRSLAFHRAAGGRIEAVELTAPGQKGFARRLDGPTPTRIP
jgi:hypothetical protein